MNSRWKLSGVVLATSIFLLMSGATAAEWNQVPLQGNDGLSNMLLVYEEAKADDVSNDEISLVLQLNSCREAEIESFDVCIDNNPEIMHPADLIEPSNMVGVGERPDETETEEPLVKDYLRLNDASITNDKISRNSDLEVELDISLNNDPEDVGAKPNIALLKNGNRIAEKEIHWDEGSVVFDWETVWTDEEERNVDLSVVMDRKSQGDYQWERQSASIGKVDIVKCGNNYVFNEFHDSHSSTEYDGCIERNEELETVVSEITSHTGWELKTEESTFHTLESIEGASTDSGMDMKIDTGEEGFCGRTYFENQYIGDSGWIKVNAKMNTLGDPSRLGWSQDPQDFFIEIDGETVERAEIEHGDSQEFTPQLDSGSTVRIGIVDEPSAPLFSCNSWNRRTSVDIQVEGSFGEKESTTDTSTDTCGNDPDLVFATGNADDYTYATRFEEIEKSSWLEDGKFIYFYGDSEDSGENVAKGSTLAVSISDIGTVKERTLDRDYPHMTVPQYKENLIDQWSLEHISDVKNGINSFEVKFESGDSGCTYSESFPYYGEYLGY